MAAQRTIIWTAACPSNIYPIRVTLDSDAWAHATDAEDGHPEILPHQQAARDAIEAPSAVHDSHNRPGSIVFVNDAVTNSQGHPLIVPVRVNGYEGIVTSIYFRPSPYPGRLIWKP